jgi:glycosyltransferase involved in cell wall biosynthesis
MHGQTFNPDARANGVAAPGSRTDAARARIVLLQTQAEAAGAQEIARILGNGLAAQGYDIHHGFFFRRTAAYDAQPRTFFCSRERPTSPWQLVRMFMALVRQLRQHKPDAVMCFQHYGNVVGTLAARCAGVRTVIANRNSVQSLVPRWLDALDVILGVTGWFAAVVVNSIAVEKEYDNHPRRYRQRLLRIDHGFESKPTVLSRDHARRVFGLPADAVLLGNAARFHPIKNLTAAIRLLPGRDWHLALAGQGAAREQLIDFARSLGVRDRLHLVGELPPTRIGDFLGTLDAFVFPSLAETFGLAVVEAAQAGVPVVANDLDVLREVLAVDGAPCALFVDVSDTEAFARAVQRVIKDGNLRTQLRSHATKLSSRYSIDAMVRSYAALIEATCVRPVSPARQGPARRHAG